MSHRDLRSASERRVRAAWRRGAGPGLRLGSFLFGVAADARNLAYECGILAPVRSAVPVLSVGGLVVGGSGKTPVAAAAARALLDRGVRPAVVTRGFPDELAVHRWLTPEALVAGAPRRSRAVAEAADRGAGAAILDDGFQHRRLARDLEWAVVSGAEVGGDGWRRLPAGPARDRWGELARADAVILTSRGASLAHGEDGALVDRLRRQLPVAAVAACRFEPSGLRPANAAARASRRPEPRLAFASVMRGEEFLGRQRRDLPSVAETVLFPDHHSIDDETTREMARAAGKGGMVGTLKDAVKVKGRLEPDVPLWYVSEEPVWWAGADGLSAQLDHVAQLALGPDRSGER